MPQSVKPPVIVVTGARGQVGFELVRSLAPLGQVIGLDRHGLDLAEPDKIGRVLQSLDPEVVVNAAAYTAVDRAEDEEAQAFCINRDAPAAIAQAAQALGAWCVHFSSDYVYDGSKEGALVETDAAAPLSVYGRSKLGGDEAMLAAPGNVVLRTSWVHGISGGNFVRTMLRLAQERDTLEVVDDQIGAPTPARLIADVTAQVITAKRAGFDALAGLYHLSASGRTSWCGYARYIVGDARRRGHAFRLAAEAIRAIPSSAYPQRAPRPKNSVLDCGRISAHLGLCLPSWQEGVDQTLEVLLR